MENRKPEVKWEKAETIEEGDMVAVISKLPLGRPRYSVSFFSKRSDGKLASHIPVRTSGQGKIEITDVYHAISALAAAAEEWIRNDAQKVEDEFIERRESRERRDLDKGKPKQKPGLKTLAKRDAMKRDVSEATTEE